MAGSPGLVAGILISTLGRSTILHRSAAWAMVPSVSMARPGLDLDRDPAVETVGRRVYVAAKMSQALRTSSVVSALMASLDAESSAASSFICSS